MKKLLIIGLSLSLLLMAKISIAVPLSSGVATVPSIYSVQETAKRLVTLLRDDKFVVRNVINHQKIAQALGHNIAPNEEIKAGRPEYDYLMIASNPQAALFVPVTFVVWQNGARKVFVSYWDPKNDVLPMLDLRKVKAVSAAREMSARLAKIVGLAVKSS